MTDCVLRLLGSVVEILDRVALWAFVGMVLLGFVQP